MPGPKEIIIILIIVVIIFGLGKLPRVMGDFGKGIRSFKKGLNEDDKQDEEQDPEKS